MLYTPTKKIIKYAHLNMLKQYLLFVIFAEIYSTIVDKELSFDIIFFIVCLVLTIVWRLSLSINIIRSVETNYLNNSISIRYFHFLFIPLKMSIPFSSVDYSIKQRGDVFIDPLYYSITLYENKKRRIVLNTIDGWDNAVVECLINELQDISNIHRNSGNTAIQ